MLGLNVTDTALGTLNIGNLTVQDGAVGMAFGLIAGAQTGTVNFGPMVNITGSTINSLLIQGPAAQADINFAGTISQSVGNATISVANGATGELTFDAGSSITSTGGTGLQFDNADGTYTFNGTTTLNGGDAGIDILNGSSGTFTFGSNTTINSPTGIALNIDGSNADVTFNGTITQNNAASAVSISNNTGGTIDIAGMVTANTSTATGIDLMSNTGATINFTGGLDIDTTTGIGLQRHGRRNSYLFGGQQHRNHGGTGHQS